jgi:hypothetical protein
VSGVGGRFVRRLLNLKDKQAPWVLCVQSALPSCPGNSTDSKMGCLLIFQAPMRNALIYANSHKENTSGSFYFFHSESISLG